MMAVILRSPASSLALVSSFHSLLIASPRPASAPTQALGQFIVWLLSDIHKLHLCDQINDYRTLIFVHLFVCILHLHLCC